MKAVAMTRSLPAIHAESLVDLELPRPEPAGRDLLVAVRAVSVNPVDAKVRAGQASPAPRVLGWDAAGVVVGLGAGATLFAPGDEVYFAGDLTRPGTNSEYCLVDERIVARKPQRLDFAEAAALPLTALTAHEALFTRLRIGRGEASRGQRLLVVGGAGGVGSIAIQLAKALTGLTVIATASRAESAQWVKTLGADHVIDHRDALGDQLAALGAPEVEYALCTADSDPYFARLGAIVAPQGALAFIVPPKEPVVLAPLLMKSVTVAFELMFTRSMFKTADMIEQQRALADIERQIIE